MRLVDMLLAFPGILLAIALAAILGPGLVDLVIALAAIGWTGYARLVRGEILSLREREYVQAAAAWAPAVAAAHAPSAARCGGSDRRSGQLRNRRHHYRGSGAVIPRTGDSAAQPTWGGMLDEGRAFLLVAPHLTTVPGLAIGLAVLGFNFLGDGLAQKVGHRA